MELGIDLKTANELVDKYIKNPVTKLHSQESQAIMIGLAKYFGENEEETEKWGIIGLLHDLDWDETSNNHSEHTARTTEYLKKFGASEFLIETIISHVYGGEFYYNKKRETKLQHSLAAAETLTGLIVATSLVLPTKTIKDVKIESLKKRFKDKKFASNCNRDIILECEKIGIDLDKFLEIGLNSLKEVADKLNI